MNLSPAIKVAAVPALTDNYIWTAWRTGSRAAVAVDPGSSAPVLKFLEEQGLYLAAILVTHAHYDHIQGIDALLEAFPGIPVYGPHIGPGIPHLTNPVGEGDIVELDDIGLRLKVLEVPGHTIEHLAYVNDEMLFCGDTLFSCGCGRVFSGTFEQLADSIQRLAALPRHLQMYCTHEYTVDNIGFAKWVEPDNPALLARDIEALKLAEQGQPTLPTTIDQELKTNPFMRLGEPSVIAAAERHAKHPLSGYREVFRELRSWKDSEYD